MFYWIILYPEIFTGNCTWLYALEIYPTSIRSIGVHICSIMARIGAIAASYLGLLVSICSISCDIQFAHTIEFLMSFFLRFSFQNELKFFRLMTVVHFLCWFLGSAPWSVDCWLLSYRKRRINHSRRLWKKESCSWSGISVWLHHGNIITNFCSM